MTQLVDANEFFMSEDGDETFEVAIKGKSGQTYSVTLKPVSWLVRNRIATKSLKIQATGNTHFALDEYYREMLERMIVSAPWGRTSAIELAKLRDVVGEQLEQYVPMPAQLQSPMASAETKKESGDS